MLLRTKETLERATHSPREQEVLQGAGRGERHLAEGRLRASLSLGNQVHPAFLAWGGMWSCPSCSPLSKLAFQSTSEALAPSPGSQHLASPSPLTSVDWTKGPNRPIVILSCASIGPFRGCRTGPLWRALPPPPPPGCPWPQPLPVWVGGLAVVKAAGSQANITEGWIVDRGHGNAPHVTGLQGTLPTVYPFPLLRAAGLAKGLHLKTKQRCLLCFH